MPTPSQTDPQHPSRLRALLAALAWSYQTPRDQAAPIAGLIGFFNERVDVTLDDELAPRPRTGWS